MQKRSFFQKLTGSYPFDDEDSSDFSNEEAYDGQKKPTVDHIPEIHTNPEGRQLDDPDSEDEEGQLTVDVYQNKDSIIIKAMVSGVKHEDLDVAITREMVTIKGTRMPESGIKDEDYFYRELYWGSFSRTIVLPQEIEPEDATAIEKHGLLTVTLPKHNKDRVQKLKVKSH